MCGITGIFHFRGAGQVEAPVLTAMRDSMSHRGPDGEGAWVSPDGVVGLGHRRLSIIDLNPNAAQPMSNEDGAVWITFNGEIYNHAGLRQELLAAGHRFRTASSDTEMLVHGYEQWGLEGLVKRISGDFAFAIWDAKRELLSVARDRIGVKPLYFSFQDGIFLFGSEIKAILRHPRTKADIDPSAMYHYLSFLTTPAPMTMFKGIFKLPAGYIAQIGRKQPFSATRYWDAVPGQDSDVREMSPKATEDYYISGIRERLEEGVRERMMSDVPFGVFLSGGIDSSTNVALMSQMMDRPVDTFTVGFKDHTHLNELEYADMVAKRFKTNHHQVLIDEKDMIGYLDRLIHSQDEPIADWVCIPLYFVSKLAKDSGTTVIQVGEGSDEQFSGYDGYMQYLKMYRKYWTRFRKLPKPAQRGIARAAVAAASSSPKFDAYVDVIDRAARDREPFWSGAITFWDVAKNRLMVDGAVRPGTLPAEMAGSGILPASYLEPDTFNVVRSYLEPFDQQHPDRDVLTRMIYCEFKMRLPELLLMRVDKITMSVSLEARVPFLAHRLVEFTMDIPMEWKTKDGVAKYLLKKAVEGLIPNEIIYRKKVGFGAPMSHWLKGEFGKRVERDVMSSRLLDRGFFDRDYIRDLFRNQRSGKADKSLYIWTLFNLTAWYDYWIEAPR